MKFAMITFAAALESANALTPLQGTNLNRATVPGSLEACIGECDNDVDCKAGLKCFQRSNGEAIPGCVGVGGGNDWDYCSRFDRELGGTNLNGRTVRGSLEACTGECDHDRDCQAELKCFQRSRGEAIPGCTGVGGGNDWDYCYNPNYVTDPTPTAPPTDVPTDEPTATPTLSPTATPTLSPTATPTATPTANVFSAAAQAQITASLEGQSECNPTNCLEWNCGQWCDCFNLDFETANYYLDMGCDNDDGDECDCSPVVAATCANVELVGQGECGLGHGSQTCPTATAPSAWCNNPSYPLRLGNPWCTENFCNQCGDMFGIVYVGCTNGVQAVANSCQACGHNSRGPCRSGAKCLGRTSLRSDYGCSANLCKTCGVVGTKPCNNGDGQQICDAGLAPRRYGNPSENNCEVEQLTCGAPWTGACSTLPNVGGTFYNVIPGTKAPDMNNEFVHGGTFIL